MKFPEKTLKWMIEIVEKHQDDKFLGKLKQTQLLDDDFKRNRWFGYYQRIGEEKGYWTLRDIIKSVGFEKENEKIKAKMT